MRLHGTIGSTKVLILVDSGSTHDFIAESLVRQLNLSTQLVTPFDVLVQLSNLEIKQDFYSFSLGGVDAVLGIRWLSSMNTAQTNWNEMFLIITINGQTYKLTGVSLAPSKYLNIVKEEGLEISQPALDSKSTDIHHRITARRKRLKFHRIYDPKSSVNCSKASKGPPCTGFVEGMAPVFSRAAWHCAWHLIQNDLVHGWGMDMKLGYCAQGSRNVGIVDCEYVLHQGKQTLGGPSANKTSNEVSLAKSRRVVDTRIEIRRQSTSELEIFKQRWEKAVKEDKDWIDPFFSRKPMHK
ncbi:hypothetical protein L1987_58787 [Smallanthus sonchifolius]|uniref:Uncharacterized protein n=1 Tax=Smallanthus sonchifolius TaxID=185202 RepID=A0ACB9D3L6_9ASTR|nr:hypothetical protein L1987_58787 [Smallanthus sonchifolius]